MNKYNLHLLGWKQFEDLCTNIMHEVLGLTFTPFSEGKDSGRDGYFEGKDSFDFNDKCLTGKFVFQCKHTSNPNKSLTFSVVENEINKIRKLVNNNRAEHYIILTNYKISADNDNIIRSKFLSILGLKSCIILGQEWFERVIDSNKILRRLVPRLYGIGDLSEVLDERVYKQSYEVLQELKANVTTFVSTKCYQDALQAIAQKRFVILLGKPATGKTAIATNICMTAIAEGESQETLILENAEQFRKHWNPDNPQKTFWFDDVFGVTNLDHNLLNDWIRTFQKLNVAIKKGVTVIFTSRDYIFNEARNKIKESSFPLLFDSQVIINVECLNISEKERILYNHIKSGDLSKEIKTKLKPLLKKSARHSNFSPELARRLGNSMFHKNLTISKSGIERFFSNPIEFFEEIIKSLDDDKKAALMLILLYGNRLPNPLIQDHLINCITNSFDATLPKIKNALNYMKDSLVKLSVLSGENIWSFYHPSMIDSLQNFIKRNPEWIEIFLYGAKVKTLFRDITCIDTNHKIFVPRNLWNVIGNRFASENLKLIKLDLIRFLIYETSDDFLKWFHQNYSSILNSLLNSTYYQLDDLSFALASRLDQLMLLEIEIKMHLVEEVCEIAIDTIDDGFLKDKYIKQLIGNKGIKYILLKYKSLGGDNFRDELRNVLENLHDEEDEYMALDLVDSFKFIINELKSRNILTQSEIKNFEMITEIAYDDIVEHLEDIKDNPRYYEKGRDYKNSSVSEQLNEQERDIFDDVDM